jgi:hypothetical protein
MITCQADGFEVLGDLSVGNAVREFLYQGEAMVRNKVRASCAEGAANDLEAVWHLYVARLNTSLASRRVKQFVDSVLMVVCCEENHVVDPMISDEFQQLITLRAITAYP